MANFPQLVVERIHWRGLPTLRRFFAIYTNDGRPSDAFGAMTNTTAFFGEMAEVVAPTSNDELFGPFASRFLQQKFKRGFLLGFSRDVKSGQGTFFTDARRALLEATKGVQGYAIDVLRLWPFPLEQAAELLPEEPLAEDLFSVGFTEMGAHGYRAETFGFAHLSQREVSFEFRGKELLEEAALMTAHLADWVMENNRRVDHGQSMAFGFDRISFYAAEGGGPPEALRGWHPPLLQKLLPETLFPGVGALEVLAHVNNAPEAQDLTVPLQRALAQRMMLEELDVTGDSPHSSNTAQVRGSIVGLRSLLAWRDEPTASKDSGWTFVSRTVSEGFEEGTLTLGEIIHRVPDVMRYLALPPGVRLEWDDAGKLQVDTTKAKPPGDFDEDSGVNG